MTDIAKIAASLSNAQRKWILTAPEGEQPVTEAQYHNAPLFWVQFSPDQYCPDTGVYLGGGERFWFASGTARGGSGGWHYRYGLNETGLAVRAHLREGEAS